MISVFRRKLLTSFVVFAAAVIGTFMVTSCSNSGWGMLLWSTEEPAIPSGTILPVLIRSNIDQVWVVGIPEAYRSGKTSARKMEIPMSHFEFAGSKSKAKQRAAAFSQYAQSYAENLQDGLPIRDNPDNGARRVYRLRIGEIVKVLEIAEGSPPISATGDPLEGNWLKVLTENGNSGYCFSFRLKLFEHAGGELAVLPSVQEIPSDPDLDMLLSKVWSPESYSAMINYGHINLEDLSKQWHFDPGQETGAARVYAPGIDRVFAYNSIQPDGTRSWRFDETSLRMSLRSDTSLAVSFIEGSGTARTLLFTALSQDVGDIVKQETSRRERLYNSIRSQGPAFTSNNYGTLIFSPNSDFIWNGYSMLVPHVIPRGTTASTGIVSMDIFLVQSLQDRYSGAFSLRFGGPAAPPVRFLYTLDSQGLRLEYIDDFDMDDNTVARRSNVPTVLYFFKDTHPSTEG